ncbi:MAG TPA: metallophosphoesterase family protein [Solirubrobacteraceae bacterium]|nr:metallophosphoesterase family protein [Solirubrobacteraceae bacterium]
MLALLYDVHGNLPALQAVLADAAERGADTYLLGGDYALFGGWPRESVELLETLDGATWIRGNGERWTHDPSGAPDDPTVQGAIAACAETLGADVTGLLAALPESAPVQAGGVAARAWHASPVSDVRSFGPEGGPEDDELLEGVEEARLYFGHTHVPFRRVGPRAIELVNPGSVGMPFDGNPRAAYALVHDDGTVRHRRVHYDHASAARRVREQARGAAWGEIVAKRIERAQFLLR